jgi:hypothetical protein
LVARVQRSNALPDARKLVTLLDASEYIHALPRTEAQGDHWQAAIEALIMAEDSGRLMHTRLGMLRALDQQIERAFNPDRKDHHWGKRKLVRDRR